MTRNAILQRARQHIHLAERMLEAQGYEACVSRAYYGMFSLARALVNTVEPTAHTHKGIHAQFTRHFIEQDGLPSELTDLLAEVYEVRQQAAQTHDLVVSPKQAETILNQARQFVSRAQELYCPSGDELPPSAVVSRAQPRMSSPS